VWQKSDGKMKKSHPRCFLKAFALKVVVVSLCCSYIPYFHYFTKGVVFFATKFIKPIGTVEVVDTKTQWYIDTMCQK